MKQHGKLIIFFALFVPDISSLSSESLAYVEHREFRAETCTGAVLGVVSWVVLGHFLLFWFPVSESKTK